MVPYRAGEDDVRRIDWNVTARSAEPHVWRTRAEHELQTWVLVDETASMDFGTVEVEKGEIAAWVTGAVGLLSDGPGNRMGVLHLRADGLAWSPALPPRRARLPRARGPARARGPDAGPRPGADVARRTPCSPWASATADRASAWSSATSSSLTGRSSVPSRGSGRCGGSAPSTTSWSSRSWTRAS